MTHNAKQGFGARSVLLSGLLLSLAVAGCSHEEAPAQSRQMSQAQPAISVEVLTLEPSQIPRSINLTGRTHAFAEAEIRPQVSGIIQARLFQEGQTVEKGDQLYKIEDSEYVVALQSAKASLASAEASARSARETEQRFKRLADLKAVSQQDYADAKASAESAEAQIDVARAAVSSAQIDLKRTLVQAPISGRIGRSSVTEGALVTANQTTALAKISQLDPIYLDMTASVSDLIDWRRRVADGTIVTSSDNNGVAVTVFFQDDGEYPYQGELEFSEVNVDESAGTVIVRAKVPNPDNMLLPGMFLRAEFEAGFLDKAYLIPQKAVQRDAKSNPYVLIVGDDGVAAQRPVVLEGSLDSNWIVTSGLQPGEQVIVSGLQKVKAGVAVKPQQAASPLASQN